MQDRTGKMGRFLQQPVPQRQGDGTIKRDQNYGPSIHGRTRQWFNDEGNKGIKKLKNNKVPDVGNWNTPGKESCTHPVAQRMKDVI